MAADYSQPANVEKRVRFFDGQHLLDQDFIDEQKYHIDRQRRHNPTLHIAGVADGLEVKPAASGATASAHPVTVTAGTAVDLDGRQLVLAQDQTIDLALATYRNKIASIYITYAKTAADPQKAGGIESDSRWQERPEIVAEVKGQAIKRGYPLLLLGELTLDGNGAITNNNAAVREYSGLRLRLPGPNAQAPTLRSDANGRVTLTGDLAVTGKVGIGTTNPNAQVDVRENVNGKLALRIHNTRTTAVGTQTALIFGGYRDNDSNEVVGKIQVRNNQGGRLDDLAHGGDMGFLTQRGSNNLRERMTITSAGNVGIGTTSPNEQVDIRKNVNGHVALRIHNERTTASGTGTALVFGGHKDIDPNFVVGKICVDHSPDWNPSIGDLSHTGDMTFHTTPGISGPVERVRITRSGNVGIGTTVTPAAKLEVNGDIKTDRAFIGDVGHGDFAGFSHKDNGTTGDYALLQHTGGTTILNASSGKNIHFRINNADKMVLDNNGNVGIGTADPAQKLDVNGNLNVTGTIHTHNRPIAYENYEIYVRGAATESPEGSSNSSLKVANVSMGMSDLRALNTVILNPDGTYKNKAHHDTFEDSPKWNEWADWVNTNAADGDVVAVGLSDALWNPSRNGQSADTLLTSIGATKAYVAGNRNRSPYALLFIKGRIGAMESLQPQGGPNAHIKTTYYNLFNFTLSATDQRGISLIVPTGVIVMWSGTIATIPRTWALCDGQNGTPDLRSRFIVCAGSGSGYTPPGNSGNPDTHHHSVDIPSNVFYSSWEGTHDHAFPSAWYNTDFGKPDLAGSRTGIDRANENIDLAVTSQVGNHRHSVPVDYAPIDSTTYTGANRPKWYALAFIMKL